MVAATEGSRATPQPAQEAAAPPLQAQIDPEEQGGEQQGIANQNVSQMDPVAESAIAWEEQEGEQQGIANENFKEDDEGDKIFNISLFYCFRPI